MSDGLADEVRRRADDAVATAREWPGGGRDLDFSEQSLAMVEELLDDVSDFDVPDESIQHLVEQFGCYVLEVGRRAYGGRYWWYDARSAPVLVVGEPDFRVAILTWDKVRGRLGGDEADNIPFHYDGFAQRVRSAQPGVDVLYV